MCTRVSNSDVFHVFWLHVLPNYCNLILKQEWPNPLLYCRNPASETLLIQLACFNRDWESSGAAAEGRPPREAPHFPSMQIHGRKTRGRLLEGSCTRKKAEPCSRLARERASPRGYVTNNPVMCRRAGVQVVSGDMCPHLGLKSHFFHPGFFVGFSGWIASWWSLSYREDGTPDLEE